MARNKDSTKSKRLFSVGERVRVISPKSEFKGTYGNVWAIENDQLLLGNDGSTLTAHTAYCVELDGIGRVDTDGLGLAYLASDLAPVYDGNKAIGWKRCAWIPYDYRKQPA